MCVPEVDEKSMSGSLEVEGAVAADGRLVVVVALLRVVSAAAGGVAWFMPSGRLGG